PTATSACCPSTWSNCACSTTERSFLSSLAGSDPRATLPVRTAVSGMSPRFVHLHLHSEFSLTDSTIRIPDLVSRCSALGLPAVSITDTSNLFALVKFQKAAEAAGVKPVAGADLWLAGDGGPPSRLTLLCLDGDGYLALSRLISRAFLE